MRYFFSLTYIKDVGKIAVINPKCLLRLKQKANPKHKEMEIKCREQW